MAASLFYIAGCAPTVYEQWTIKCGPHGQAFPQKGARIISDSGCLGLQILGTIRWLWDLKGKEYFHRAPQTRWRETRIVEEKTTPASSDEAELSPVAWIAAIWCGETAVTAEQSVRQTDMSRVFKTNRKYPSAEQHYFPNRSIIVGTHKLEHRCFLSR